MTMLLATGSTFGSLHDVSAPGDSSLDLGAATHQHEQIQYLFLGRELRLATRLLRESPKILAPSHHEQL